MARGSILEKNSGAGGLLSNVEHITAKTLEEKDSGKVFMCSSEGGANCSTYSCSRSKRSGVQFIVHEETPTLILQLQQEVLSFHW